MGFLVPYISNPGKNSIISDILIWARRFESQRCGDGKFHRNLKCDGVVSIKRSNTTSEIWRTFRVISSASRSEISLVTKTASTKTIMSDLSNYSLLSRCFIIDIRLPMKTMSSSTMIKHEQSFTAFGMLACFWETTLSLFKTFWLTATYCYEFHVHVRGMDQSHNRLAGGTLLSSSSLGYVANIIRSLTFPIAQNRIGWKSGIMEFTDLN